MFQFIAHKIIYMSWNVFLGTEKWKNGDFEPNYHHFSLEVQFKGTYVDQKVNKCWLKFQNLEDMYSFELLSVYTFWQHLEVSTSS